MVSCVDCSLVLHIGCFGEGCFADACLLEKAPAKGSGKKGAAAALAKAALKAVRGRDAARHAVSAQR